MVQIVIFIGFAACLIALLWLFLWVMGYGPDQIEWNESCDILMANIANMDVTPDNYKEFEKEFEILKNQDGFNKKRFQSSYVNFMDKYHKFFSI